MTLAEKFWVRGRIRVRSAHMLGNERELCGVSFKYQMLCEL